LEVQDVPQCSIAGNTNGYCKRFTGSLFLDTVQIYLARTKVDYLTKKLTTSQLIEQSTEAADEPHNTQMH